MIVLQQSQVNHWIIPIQDIGDYQAHVIRLTPIENPTYSPIWLSAVNDRSPLDLMAGFRIECVNDSADPLEGKVLLQPGGYTVDLFGASAYTTDLSDLTLILTTQARCQSQDA